MPRFSLGRQYHCTCHQIACSHTTIDLYNGVEDVRPIVQAVYVVYFSPEAAQAARGPL